MPLEHILNSQVYYITFSLNYNPCEFIMTTETITINGGSNQILPNATQSIQIFIGDEFLNQMSNATDKLKVEVVSTPFFSMKFNFFLFTLKINWKFSFNRR